MTTDDSSRQGQRRPRSIAKLKVILCVVFVTTIWCFLNETKTSMTLTTVFIPQKTSHVIAVLDKNKEPQGESPQSKYGNTMVDVRILSELHKSYFDKARSTIDEDDPSTRCQRYGYTYHRTKQRNRRIFYGAIIANEPWELFEIVAAEVYGMFHAMAFVESNRTQNFALRTFLRLDDGPILAQLFEAQNVAVRPFVNETKNTTGLGTGGRTTGCYFTYLD
eukprot:scaffold9676_cov200-Amphora_coffeaeformis.AAC.2